jgi:hypothetical protein
MVSMLTKARALYGKKTEIKPSGFTYATFYFEGKYVWVKFQFPCYDDSGSNQVYNAQIARCRTKKQADFLATILNNILGLLES